MPSTIENQHSGLLTYDENLQVFKLLGTKCQTICTTVIQLYVTKRPSHLQWFKKDTGILCFVKDNIRKNYFFRLYCLRRNLMVWEHEMYNNMEYTESTNFLHVFEGEDGIVAFNFASTEEAAQLKNMVIQKIQLKKKREEKKAKYQSQSLHLPSNTFNDISAYKKKPNPEAKLAKRKRNITKADISVPMDFKHISHVGFNPNSGFDILSEDEQLTAFFQKAGVTEKQLQDDETRKFIYNFISNYNGPDEGTNGPPPAVPPRGPQRSSHGRVAPPPPPSMRPPEHSAPKKLAPSPVPKAPAPSQVQQYNSAPAAPPPPPPPPPMMNLASPPPMMNTTNGAVPAPPSPPLDNSALMESIRNGTNLKPVEERKSTPQEDARSDLLSEIRKGMKLKPVDEREVKPAPSPKQSGGSDLAGALARALAERSKAIYSEDDSDDSDSNEDDWED